MSVTNYLLSAAAVAASRVAPRLVKVGQAVTTLPLSPKIFGRQLVVNELHDDVHVLHLSTSPWSTGFAFVLSGAFTLETLCLDDDYKARRRSKLFLPFDLMILNPETLSRFLNVSPGTWVLVLRGKPMDREVVTVAAHFYEVG